MRVNDLVFKRNFDIDRNPEIAVVYEDGSMYYTVCFFVKTNDGYDLRTVGDRILQVNEQDFLALARYAFAVLNAEARLDDYRSLL